MSSGSHIYTADSRFSVLNRPGSPDWILMLKSPQLYDSGTYECQVNKSLLKTIKRINNNESVIQSYTLYAFVTSVLVKNGLFFYNSSSSRSSKKAKKKIKKEFSFYTSPCVTRVAIVCFYFLFFLLLANQSFFFVHAPMNRPVKLIPVQQFLALHSTPFLYDSVSRRLKGRVTEKGDKTRHRRCCWRGDTRRKKRRKEKAFCVQNGEPLTSIQIARWFGHESQKYVTIRPITHCEG